MGKKTVLYDTHQKLGAKMVEFGGWDMPVQYTGIIDEHNTVRNHAGIFDVSHMGQIFVSGNDALPFLQKVVPQENVEKDFNWFKKNATQYDVKIDNRSDEFSMFAIQGPNACKIVEKSGIIELKQPKFFTITKAEISGYPVYISRTGYTGEDGFEIVVRNENALVLWDLLMDKGGEFGLKPIGLGARDTLRLEAALMLYGNDLSESTTPVEAGLKWSIPQDKKEDYNGKSVIMSQIESGVQKKLIGFEMIDRAIARHEYEIYYNGQKAGIVTSGGFSPTLNKNIGMGYIDTKYDIKLDSVIQIMVRNKLYNAKVVKRPFVKKRYKNS